MFDRHCLCRTLGVGFTLAALIVCARPALAQTTAAGPYYATPSWDQSLPAGTRFIVLTNYGNAAVLDRETGLVWERSPSTDNFLIQPPPGVFGGPTAQERCVGLNIANHLGWRIPTIQELASLLDPSQPAPKLPAGHPFSSIQTDPFFDEYWSATQYANNVEPAFRIINFGSGFTGAAGVGVVSSFHVWCVRGGSAAPVQ